MMTLASDKIWTSQSCGSHDFVHDRTHERRKFKIFNIIDEYTRKYLAIRVKRKLNSRDVIDALSDLFLAKGIPKFFRSDNGLVFSAQSVRGWIALIGSKTVYNEPGPSWIKWYCKSYNARLKDELLNGEIFLHWRKRQVLIELWPKHNNTIRTRCSLNWQSPTPEWKIPMDQITALN